MNDIWGLVFRWLHVIPAMIMVGGVFFLRFSLLESGNGQPSLLDSRDEVRRRWVKWVMLSTLLLLVSGLYNSAMKEMNFDVSPLYRGLLTVKILLALIVFYLSAVLAGRSERAKRFRQQEKRWLNILLLLMILVVMIGSCLKFESTDFSRKVRGEVPAVVGDNATAK
jgi:uncharacterized membrane protein